VIAYDDSDGWYDHVMPPVMNQSTGSADALTGPGACGTAATSLPGVNVTANPHALGRCGYGPRLPLLVISPYAKENYVSSSLSDTASVTKFIEDNWLSGERLGNGSYDASSGSLDDMFNFSQFPPNVNQVILNPTTGEVVNGDGLHPWSS
jgi:phospholipase C